MLHVYDTICLDVEYICSFVLILKVHYWFENIFCFELKNSQFSSSHIQLLHILLLEFSLVAYLGLSISPSFCLFFHIFKIFLLLSLITFIIIFISSLCFHLILYYFAHISYSFFKILFVNLDYVCSELSSIWITYYSVSIVYFFLFVINYMVIYFCMSGNIFVLC